MKLHYTYEIIPLDGDTPEQTERAVARINSLRAAGMVVTYQQLMIYTGRPYLLVVLEDVQGPSTDIRPATNPVSEPVTAPYDPNRGLATPFEGQELEDA